MYGDTIIFYLWIVWTLWCGWMCQYTSDRQSSATILYWYHPCMWLSSSSQFDGKGFIIDGVAYLCKDSKAAMLTIFGIVVSRMK